MFVRSQKCAYIEKLKLDFEGSSFLWLFINGKLKNPHDNMKTIIPKQVIDMDDTEFIQCFI